MTLICEKPNCVKKIEDAQKANEDLKRKLEQGSSQLQGEVLELELERYPGFFFPAG